MSFAAHNALKTLKRSLHGTNENLNNQATDASDNTMNSDASFLLHI